MINSTSTFACVVCGNEGTHKCSRCKIACYCGPQCQQNDWSKHKHMCITKGTTYMKSLETMHGELIDNLCMYSLFCVANKKFPDGTLKVSHNAIGCDRQMICSIVDKHSSGNDIIMDHYINNTLIGSTAYKWTEGDCDEIYNIILPKFTLQGPIKGVYEMIEKYYNDKTDDKEVVMEICYNMDNSLFRFGVKLL